MLAPIYPEILPYASGWIQVSEVHGLWVEECGNRDGVPALFLHGGPGAGVEPFHRRLFDPDHYRIVLFDQRGAGRSRPRASLHDNTTWHLVADIEHIRRTLGIERWIVLGGSWGSTLALAYAQQHPERVAGLILRGVFTFTEPEVGWYLGGGARALFPDAWDEFVAAIPRAERGDPIAAYHRRLIGDDLRERERAARAWTRWECRIATLIPDPDFVALADDPDFALAFARIECHYFAHRGFLAPGQLLDRAAILAGIPTRIVHGRWDVVCPLRSAWELHRRLPASMLTVVPDAGHAASEPGIAAAIVGETDAMRELAAQRASHSAARRAK